PRRQARRGDGDVGRAGDDLPRPGAGEEVAQGSPRQRLRADRAVKEQTHMSSHREAPEISKDPVADNTDTYAFVSPNRPDTVTLISNYVPLEEPPGGPNFFEFGDDVLYQILIDNDGDGLAEVTYQFRFQTQVPNPNTFLYNTGPITSISSTNWNRRQFYSVTVVDGAGNSNVLARGLACPPCNIG